LDQFKKRYIDEGSRVEGQKGRGERDREGDGRGTEREKGEGQRGRGERDREGERRGTERERGKARKRKMW